MTGSVTRRPRAPVGALRGNRSYVVVVERCPAGRLTVGTSQAWETPSQSRANDRRAGGLPSGEIPMTS